MYYMLLTVFVVCSVISEVRATIKSPDYPLSTRNGLPLTTDTGTLSMARNIAPLVWTWMRLMQQSKHPFSSTGSTNRLNAKDLTQQTNNPFLQTGSRNLHTTQDLDQQAKNPLSQIGSIQPFSIQGLLQSNNGLSQTGATQPLNIQGFMQPNNGLSRAQTGSTQPLSIQGLRQPNNGLSQTGSIQPLRIQGFKQPNNGLSQTGSTQALSIQGLMQLNNRLSQTGSIQPISPQGMTSLNPFSLRGSAVNPVMRRQTRHPFSQIRSNPQGMAQLFSSSNLLYPEPDFQDPLIYVRNRDPNDLVKVNDLLLNDISGRHIY